MRFTPAAFVLLLVAGCGRGPAPAANQAEPAPPPAPAADRATADVGAAERLVRARLGNPQDLAFGAPRLVPHDGVTVVCGELTQSGRRQRYIVAGEEAFVESRMRAGEMDRAMREFCGEGERG